MKSQKMSVYFILLLSIIYFISQFNRASLGSIPEFLINDFYINNEELGRLGGVFFLSFALVQIPIGILLDKFNPFKIIFIMLIFIFAGTICLSFSTTYGMLILGRTLQGIGCGVCLMGPLVIIAKYAEKEKFSYYSAYIMGLGGLGALVATKPFFILTNSIGWRTSFFFIAVLNFLLIVYIFYFLLTKKTKFSKQRYVSSYNLNFYMKIFLNKNFIFMLPMSFFGYASFAFLLTLWGNRYLLEVQYLKKDDISTILMAMAFFWSLGSIFYGYLDKAFKKKKIIIISTLFIIFLISILCFFKNLSLLQNYLIFCLLGFVGAYTLIVISHYRILFEETVIGKVLTAANLFNFAGVFFVQWLTGFILHISINEFGFAIDFGYKIALISILLFLIFAIVLYNKTDET